ncbi:hypothetical protein TCAL_00517 [Tigriopus californicus]|uniref:very-long-chain enoyl-CoA reductase n=1 Tax=Tigriopus californicus TaxID=6832 RepID=A0A553PB40_TIGCA|nr:hypothetical protein TCAL_00517 [Tigriopus californicus]
MRHLEIVNAKSERHICMVKGLSQDSTIKDVKKAIGAQKQKYADINRQEIRLEARGKFVKDEDTLGKLGVQNQASLYFKDRGLQIGWTTVFLTEYAGPLIVYLWIYTRPWLFYGDGASSKPYASAVNIAMGAWSFHYLKRLLETMFVHRFSNATMPIMNIFKNSAYYWGFAAYVAYHINHPLYTPPSQNQVIGGLVAFVINEIGNLGVHIALRNLRPPGTKVRKIPLPTGNPFTLLFNCVSCPNYTYEIGAWVSFTIMTQCLPAGLFCLAGAYQMTMWALGKHRNYKKEFPNYPKRKAIIPFVL